MLYFIRLKQAFSLNFAAKKRESFEFTPTRINGKINSPHTGSAGNSRRE